MQKFAKYAMRREFWRKMLHLADTTSGRYNIWQVQHLAGTKIYAQTRTPCRRSKIIVFGSYNILQQTTDPKQLRQIVVSASYDNLHCAVAASVIVKIEYVVDTTIFV